MSPLARLHSLFAKPASKVARASREAVPTQAIGAYRAKATQATINGLKAVVDDAARTRFEERVEAVLRMRGSA